MQFRNDVTMVRRKRPKSIIKLNKLLFFYLQKYFIIILFGTQNVSYHINITTTITIQLYNLLLNNNISNSG